MKPDAKVELKVEGLEEFKKALTDLESALNKLNAVEVKFEVTTKKHCLFTKEEIEEIVRGTVITYKIDSDVLAKAITDQIVKSV